MSALPRGGLGVVFRKELWSFFVNPVSYLIFFLIYLYRGYETWNLVRLVGDGGDAEQFAMAYLGGQSTSWVVILVPALLTMRTFSEEKRTGSIELLLTAPIRDHEVVAGKFLAAWVFYGLLWLPAMLLLPLLQATWFLDTSLPIGMVATGFLGLFLLGSLLLSVGVLTSSLTDHQLLASLSSILVAYALLSFPPQLIQGLTNVDSGIGSVLLEQLAVANHLRFWFFRGLVDTGHLVFYLATTLLMLFLSTRVLEARTWR